MQKAPSKKHEAADFDCTAPKCSNHDVYLVSYICTYVNAWYRLTNADKELALDRLPLDKECSY